MTKTKLNGHISDTLDVDVVYHNEEILGNPPVLVDVAVFRSTSWGGVDRQANLTLTAEELRGLSVLFSELATKAEVIGKRWAKLDERDAKREAEKVS